MDSSRLKNIILIILIAANLVLGSIAAADISDHGRMTREALEGAWEILARSGIKAAPGTLDRIRFPDTIVLRRSLQEEEKNVSALLGSVQVNGQGGNIIYYSGDIGEAVLRGTGGFEILFNCGVGWSAKSPEDTALLAAKKFGLTVSDSEGAVSGGLDANGDGSFELLCSRGGIDVVNCRATVTFAGGNIFLMTGTRVLETSDSRENTALLDLPTIMMRFLEIVREGGYICSELRGISICYIQESSASGDGNLRPVWRIVTDSGEFFLNGETGKRESDFSVG